MKYAWLLVLLCSLNAAAQDARPARPLNDVTESVADGTWDFGAVASGGAGLGDRFSTKFASAGVRIGRILTRDHGSGWARGNFEWAVEMLPVYMVLTPRQPVYGGSFVPADWRWNFTSGRRMAPYARIAGGILFSTQNIPPGNTSWVNFTPQAAVGANVFLKPGRAFLFEGAYVHHSNAHLGTDNPGYNAAFVFTVGYTWFKHPE